MMKDAGFSMSEKTIQVNATFDIENQRHCATGYSKESKCVHFQNYVFVHFLTGTIEKPVCEFWKIGLKHDGTKVLRCDGCVSAFEKCVEVKPEPEFIPYVRQKRM